MHDRGSSEYFFVFANHLEWMHPEMEILVRDVPFLLHWLATAELLFVAGAMSGIQRSISLCSADRR
jgi:hypothetical protein